MKANADHYPERLEYLGSKDGYYFNYNIKQREVNDNGSTRITYDYDYVYLHTQNPTEELIANALRAHSHNNEEVNQILGLK